MTTISPRSRPSAFRPPLVPAPAGEDIPPLEAFSRGSEMTPTMMSRRSFRDQRATLVRAVQEGVCAFVHAMPCLDKNPVRQEGITQPISKPGLHIYRAAIACVSVVDLGHDQLSHPTSFPPTQSPHSRGIFNQRTKIAHAPRRPRPSTSAINCFNETRLAKVSRLEMFQLGKRAMYVQGVCVTWKR